jgi:hypothetical protein
MAAPADAAEAVESAEETIFTLAQTVDLQSGHTANVPIVDRDFPAPRIDLLPFQTTHPLAAVRLRNDDTHSLPAGVLTVYDQANGASFAGDARLGGLPAGESRLLSYAQDLRTTAETKLSPQPDTFLAFSVADGVLSYTVGIRQVAHINVTAPAKESRDLLLEIPRSDGEQTLTLDDGKTHATEQTATAFRISLTLEPGETRPVTAWLDQPQRRTEELVDGDDDILQSIVGADKLNPAGRTALNHVLDLRRDAARKQAELVRQRKILADVEQDEDRIRKNLAAVTSADPLRARLTKALDADETRIDQLRNSIDLAQADADKSHRTLADAIATLHI